MEIKKIKQSIIRVDHAGEYAATYIYKGQIAAFAGNKNVQETVKEMLATEETHLEFFTEKLQKEQVRPTMFLPLWKILGFGLGWVTAFCGEKAAMVCTTAVENVIEKHYSEQISILESSGTDDNLKENIIKIRQEEIEHIDISMKHNVDQSLFCDLISNIVKFGCKCGIFLSKRL